MNARRVPITVDAVFVDGAGSGNVNTHAAWAVIAVRYTGTAKDVLEVVATETGVMLGATHQQAELQAVIEALQWCGRTGAHAEIVSDSAYVADGLNECWYDRWRTNGWRASKGGR
jgi:ribonuclease HI